MEREEMQIRKGKKKGGEKEEDEEEQQIWRWALGGNSASLFFLVL